jgi:hypothetical protein
VLVAQYLALRGFAASRLRVKPDPFDSHTKAQ